jgi:hypothetical protein
VYRTSVCNQLFGINRYSTTRGLFSLTTRRSLHEPSKAIPHCCFAHVKTTFIIVGEAAVEGPAERGLAGEGSLQVASPTQA